MTVTVLPQLSEAETLLSDQEAELMQQLAAIQEKRKGLQMVMAMFDASANSNGQSAPAVEAPAVEAMINLAEVAAVETEIPEVNVTAKSAKTTKAKVSARKPKATKTPKVAKTTPKATKTTAKATKTPKTTQTKTVRKATQAKKTDGRAANWQRYVLDDYRQQPLPDVVANFLKAKPKNIFKIADVMSAIFEEGMPKAQFLKARNRISNILSAGARNQDWYRGRGGTYSASEKAVKAS